jgi:uncharacterized protein
MEMLDNSITWFEIPVSDFERARKFYSAIYDFDMPSTQVGEVKMGFFIYEQIQHRVGGAICFGAGYTPSQTGVLAYLNAGEDLSVVLNRIENAGGKILKPKTFAGEGIGYVAQFVDTEGNRIALHSRK